MNQKNQAKQNRRIQVLDPIVSERIAAGEVIEKPYSVVKELVENSIDAGATHILVSLEDGGKGLIEVLDNGSGIHPKDLGLSLKRHATSKLKKLEDLDSISSLGFRGEALASVAACSDLKIVSRRKDHTDAYVIESDSDAPKKITFGEFLGDSNGTCIRAEGLFSKIPARLKFLRSARSEVTAVREWIQNLSLTHPEIHFQLSHQDKSVLDLKPTTLEKRLRKILAQDQDFPIESIESENPRIQIWWFRGLSVPNSKKVIQRVNGRILRDRLVMQAVLKPFRQVLLPGQYPALMIDIDIPPSELDVNIHPTKTEVRFLNSSGLFHQIDKVTERMVLKKGAIGHVASSNPSASRHVFAVQPMLKVNEPEMSDPSTHEQNSLELSASSEQIETTSPLETPWKFQGILFRTYIMLEKSHQVRLVDQHAAHERIRYEKLKNQIFGKDKKIQKQESLIPITLSIPEDAPVDFRERLNFLTQMGFEVELFSDESVIFRAIPAVWGEFELKTRLANLIEKLCELKLENLEAIDEFIFEKLASEACHSAIRAGDTIQPWQALEIHEELLSCEHPWNCPHGRPTMVELSKSKMDEWFQRLV